MSLSGEATCRITIRRRPSGSSNFQFYFMASPDNDIRLNRPFNLGLTGVPC